jgi:hypothetical protein
MNLAFVGRLGSPKTVFVETVLKKELDSLTSVQSSHPLRADSRSDE